METEQGRSILEIRQILHHRFFDLWTKLCIVCPSAFFKEKSTWTLGASFEKGSLFSFTQHVCVHPSQLLCAWEYGSTCVSSSWPALSESPRICS